MQSEEEPLELPQIKEKTTCREYGALAFYRRDKQAEGATHFIISNPMLPT